MTERVVTIIPARLDSRRLPRKQLRSMAGQPMINYLLRRMESVSEVDETIVATSSREVDDPLEEWTETHGIDCYRGDLENVLQRLAEAAVTNEADIVVRANGDNPLLAPEVTAAGIELMQRSAVEYVTGKNLFTGLPVGIGPGIIRTDTLVKLSELAENSHHKEHVTTYIFENHSEFNWNSIPIKKAWKKPELSVTVDTREEFKYVERIIETLPPTQASEWTIEDIISASQQIEETS